MPKVREFRLSCPDVGAPKGSVSRAPQGLKSSLLLDLTQAKVTLSARMHPSIPRMGQMFLTCPLLEGELLNENAFNDAIFFFNRPTCFMVQKETVLVNDFFWRRPYNKTIYFLIGPIGITVSVPYSYD